MPYEIINIPKPYKYISEVVENGLHPEFKEDFPDNIYLDKTSTGSGATTFALTNDVDYVLAVPFISLGENKVIQADEDPNFYPHKLFMFYGAVLDKDLKAYLASNNTHKILVTYDSLPRLMELIDTKRYKLFVDEAHKLTEYVGNFKPAVIMDLLDAVNEFKSFVYCTATPTREEYLPERVKPVRKIKLDWKTGQAVNFNTLRLKNNQIRDTVLSICVDHHKGDREGNAYFFYNSVASIAKICKDLDKIGIPLEGIKVICADTPENRRALKTANKKLKPRKSIETDEEGSILIDNKKITFVTSTAFEGQDFVDSEGVTYILSDGRLDHTVLDISTQVSQIVGRLRNSRFKNDVNLIWSVAPTKGFSTMEEYSKYVEEKKQEALEVLKVYEENNQTTKRVLAKGVEAIPEMKTFLIDTSDIENEPDIVFNEDATNYLLNMFEGTSLQYFVNSDNIDESTDKHVQFTLRDVFAGEVNDSFKINKLSSSIKLLLGKKANFSSIVTRYIRALTIIQQDKVLPSPNRKIVEESIEFVELIKSDSAYETLVEYIELFGVDQELADKGTTAKSEKYLEAKILKYKEQERLKEFLRYRYEIGTIKSNADFKKEIEEIYEKQDITGTAKATDLNLVFKTKSTSTKVDGVKINCLRIEGLL